MKKITALLLSLLFIQILAVEPVTNKIFKKYSKITEVPSATIQTLLARRVFFPLSKDYLKNWRMSCLKKPDINCRFYGLSILNNGNIDLAKDFFKRTCLKGDSESCLLFYQLANTKKERELSVTNSKKLCNKRGSECFAYERILFSENKSKEAISLSKKNCLERSFSKSCKNLFGGFLSSLEMKELNPAKELKKRCELKDQISCFQRTLIDSSLKFADSLLILVDSCKAGIFEACNGLVAAVSKNEKLLDNSTFAKTVAFVCSLGDMKACAIAGKLDKKKYSKELRQLEYINCHFEKESKCYEHINNFKPKEMVDFKTIKVPKVIGEFVDLNFKKCSFVVVDKVKFEDQFVNDGYKLECEKKDSRTRALLYKNGQLKSLEDFNKKGQRHGPTQFYNHVGEIIKVVNYSNGKKDKDVSEFHIPGVLKSIKNYRDGVLKDISQYHKNGVISSFEKYDEKGRIVGDRYRFGKQGGVVEKSLFKNGEQITPLRKYNIEKLNFVEINTFEILKLADKYKCIRRNFEINDYLLEQKTLEQSAFLDFIDNTYYEGVNSLGRKVYFVKDKKKCSPAIKAIKRASN